VHEKQHHQHCLEHGYRQRHVDVERPEIQEGHLDRKRRHDKQRQENRNVNL
jgi:hypothetical protein